MNTLYEQLMTACREGDMPSVVFLAERYSNLIDGKIDALRISSFYGNFEIAEYLISKGALPSVLFNYALRYDDRSRLRYIKALIYLISRGLSWGGYEELQQFKTKEQVVKYLELLSV